MHPPKLAWFVAAALVTTMACSPSKEPEPAPLGNPPPASAPAQQLDSTEAPPSADPPPSSLGASSADPPAAVDAGAADASPAPKKDVTACIAACEAQYPGGSAKSKMIDQCWADHCSACQTMKPGAFYTPASGSCQTGVYTWSKDCSQCTADWCCWAWDMCFGDAECKSLNDCSVACTK